MRKSKTLSVGAVVAAVTLLGGVLFGGVADAKKKRGSATVTRTLNAPIPNRIANDPGVPWGTLRTQIVLGKKYKGLTIGDINVTLQTTGFSADAAGDLVARLTAPNGNTTTLFSDGMIGISIGQLTLDDETRISLCKDPTPPCIDPDNALSAPYFGKAAPDGWLGHLDGGRMNGPYTLSVFDTDATPPEGTSVLNFWRLNVTAAANTRKQV